MSDPKQMSIAERFAAIARAARRADTDENMGDAAETAETILWYATEGSEGEDWGCAYDD